jgi:long-subunit acyl-CoA synthetase (AMP-forming)/predicted GNAT family acetyltransferase
MAEKALHLVPETSQEVKTWHMFLDFTSKPAYLEALPDRETRYHWAEVVFKIIQITRFSLKDLFLQRVDEHRQDILFQDMSQATITQFSYEQVYRHVREIAAVFHDTAGKDPRVAIFCENSVESASCDLACLFYDMFVTPLNVHFSKDILVSIFNQLEISIVVTDTNHRLDILEAARKETKHPFTIYVTDSNIRLRAEEDDFLGERCKSLSEYRIISILEKRKRKPIHEVATTMFTSGTTGIPKGVSFSVYNLVSKRFARGAALPGIGSDEIMLCYLPLYHTFGRYLEMLGTIYWGGKYVFVGNPSKETLLKLFPKISPTIFISVPLRWAQLHEEATERMEVEQDSRKRKQILKKIVGKRLKWGLSAAGYLDPKTFRFFQDHGIQLSSGFGMTEATGGITMTPPGEYYDNSTGIPLPGVYLRFSEENEMEISGHYIARYLEDAGPGDPIEYPGEKDQYYLATGDIFRIDDHGHYSIVDRVKDIYKNNKGQTVAPRTVEQKFAGVPGIKRTFLVGDAQPYNVLIIIPDYDDPVLKDAPGDQVQIQYFHQIVTAANKDLAPFERVINFTLLDRDFSLEKGELTPKGSFNRKVIEKNLAREIKELYKQNFIILESKNVRIKIPRWIYRDLGILENDIRMKSGTLINQVSGTVLPVRKESAPDTYLIGDLIYTIHDDLIDLGLFTRQPRLWIGNPSLIQFCPCKEGWDLPLEPVSAQVILPGRRQSDFPHNEFPQLEFVRDQKLNFINHLICCALFSESHIALQCTRQIGDVFSDYDEHVGVVIRRRLEALSRHRNEKVRARAYQTLLLHDPHLDYSKLFPTFIQSGLSFLTEQSIREITRQEIGKQKMESLRQRLLTYRKQLEWPAETSIQNQFKNLLKLLFNFAMENLEYYIPIRSELASWILHERDPILSHVARKYFIELNHFFEESSLKDYSVIEEDEWRLKLNIEPGITEDEHDKILNVLVGTIFLQQSIKLAYDESNFDLGMVPPRGIWITKLPASFHFYKYRLSVNTNSGRHYDLCLMLHDGLSEPRGMKTIYLWAYLAGHPYGLLSLPALGCSQPLMGAMTSKYLSELSAWDKIREYAGLHYSLGYINKPNAWRKLIVKALKVFFNLWQQSDHEIIPGYIGPENVVVPELDYLETATVQSLAGWDKYESPQDLVIPMIRNFYDKTIAHYPWCKKQLDIHWIFDACIEALGFDQAIGFLEDLYQDLHVSGIQFCKENELRSYLKDYLREMKDSYYLPIAVFNAIDQYTEWEKLNPGSTPAAREQTMFELTSLFRLYKYPEVVRYYFYRHTYFTGSDEKTRSAFDDLLNKITEDVSVSAIQHTELYDLQSAIKDEEDRLIFSRMVFSRMQNYQKVDLLKIGEEKSEQVLVTTEITDKKKTKYTIREPIDASEIGQLYRLFYEENYPKTISEMDKHFVVLDARDQVIGGLCYIPLEHDVILLDGAAVTTPLKGRGIGTAMIEDFCARMAEKGTKVIKAHFLHGSFYLKLKFKVDQKWGALVRFLN